MCLTYQNIKFIYHIEEIYIKQSKLIINKSRMKKEVAKLSDDPLGEAKNKLSSNQTKYLKLVKKLGFGLFEKTINTIT